MSTLDLSCADAVTLVLPKLRPRVQGMLLAVRGDRLHVELAGVETHIRLLGAIDLAVSLVATMPAPGQVEIDVRVERALGPLAFLVRRLLKQIMEAVLPAELRGVIIVASATRVCVDLEKLPVGPGGAQRVGEFAEVTALALPADGHALRAEFTVRRIP